MPKVEGRSSSFNFLATKIHRRDRSGESDYTSWGRGNGMYLCNSKACPSCGSVQLLRSCCHNGAEPVKVSIIPHTHTHTLRQICLVFISVCSLKLTACAPPRPPAAFSRSSPFDASLETRELLMETRKRLLTTLPSCHSCQFITAAF